MFGLFSSLSTPPPSNAITLFFPTRQTDVPITSLSVALQELKERPQDHFEIEPGRFIVTKLELRRTREGDEHDFLVARFLFDNSASNEFIVQSHCPPSRHYNALPGESPMRDAITICAKFSRFQLSHDHTGIRTLSVPRRSQPFTVLELVTMAHVISLDQQLYAQHEKRCRLFANALFDCVYMKFGGDISLKGGNVRPLAIQHDRLLKNCVREWQNVYEAKEGRKREASRRLNPRNTASRTRFFQTQKLIDDLARAEKSATKEKKRRELIEAELRRLQSVRSLLIPVA